MRALEVLFKAAKNNHVLCTYECSKKFFFFKSMKVLESGNLRRGRCTKKLPFADLAQSTYKDFFLTLFSYENKNCECAHNASKRQNIQY